MSSEKAVSKFDKAGVLLVFKGAAISLVASIVGILLFAVVLKFASLSDLVIKIVNQIIKILSVFFGVLFSTKKDKSKGILKGVLIGMLYTLFAYACFSVLSNSFAWGLSMLFDCLFAGIFGAVFGVILVNSKK